MIVVDSCGWLEYFFDGALAERYYQEYLRHPEEIIVPTVVLYEVYKKIKAEKDEETANLVAVHLKKSRVIDLDEEIAFLSADLSLKHSLHMADAIVYATSQREESLLVTSDLHLKNLKGVIFIDVD